MENAVVCAGLSKRYGGVTALDGFDLAVPRGTAFGVLGPNGAGKSTLVRLLLGFVRPSAGSVTVLGETNVERARPRVGYLPERPHYDGLFSARDYLRGLGQIMGLGGAALERRIDGLIGLVGLSEAADRRLRTYSKGMLQRAGIAQALLGDPELLILDEPSSGLDPRGQWEMAQIILRVRGEGRTVLLCSHALAEVQRLCARACIVRGGRVAWEGELGGGPFEPRTRIEPAQQNETVRSALLTLPGAAWQGEALLLPAAHQAEALRVLLDLGIPVRALNPERPSLEDVYLRATAR
jgi:ABC-2 type transport system ATP-binding protein